MITLTPDKTTHVVINLPNGTNIHLKLAQGSKFDCIHPTAQFLTEDEVFGAYPDLAPPQPPPPPPVIIDVEAALSRLWHAFDTYARAQTDDNSRVSISLIAANPASTAQQLTRATEWANWWRALWTVYAVKRAALVTTEAVPVTDFATEVGTAPWTIWEIAE